jgi:hypothetical protein
MLKLALFSLRFAGAGAEDAGVGVSPVLRELMQPEQLLAMFLAASAGHVSIMVEINIKRHGSVEAG